MQPILISTYLAARLEPIVARVRLHFRGLVVGHPAIALTVSIAASVLVAVALLVAVAIPKTPLLRLLLLVMGLMH